MRITVTDTNIFIDLIYLDWLGHLISLGLEIYTTEYVLLELHDHQRIKLEKLAKEGIMNVRLIQDIIIEEVEAMKMPRSFSQTDRSVVWLSEKIHAMVLTGDAPVRKFCEKAGIEVHGILWVFDMVVEKEIINQGFAAEMLEKLMEYNKRLPVGECEKRIDKWKS